MQIGESIKVMPDLSIRDFSCIHSANIELKKLNVIIGQQGSGKSVATKLIYFFTDMLPSILKSAEDGLSLDEFKRQIERNFCVWFPPQAWGSKRFVINYSDGNFQCRIMRRKISSSLSHEVRVSLSAWTEKMYVNSLSAFSSARTQEANSIAQSDLSAHSELERFWRVRSKLREELTEQATGFAAFSQTFIPAGRAFFTSIGRLVAGIEHAGSLDPATLKFARLFANWRDRSGYIVASRDMPDYQELRKSTMFNLFRGSVQSKRDAEFIEMDDGRRVPFSSLSSGQQELLPIWYFLDNLMTMDSLRSSRSGRGPQIEKEIIYIEEPEAHLFPESQAILLDTLISMVLGTSMGSERRLVITTHSPYIMSRLNVLLKAGQLGKRRKKIKDISEVVPRSAWLRLEEISVQCIEDGKLRSIIDDDEGLIDAHFLDAISDTITRDFTTLLDIEEA